MNAEIIAKTESMPYEEWLDLRKNGIGGSDAAAVCGISRYKSRLNSGWRKPTA